MSGHELAIYASPIISEQEAEAVLRLLRTQPDADMLAEILGLTPPAPAKPPASWCAVHNIEKRQRMANGRPSGWRCNPCSVANNRASAAARKARARNVS